MMKKLIEALRKKLGRDELRLDDHLWFNGLDNVEAHILYKELTGVITNQLRTLNYVAEGYVWTVTPVYNRYNERYCFLLTCKGYANTNHGKYLETLVNGDNFTVERNDLESFSFIGGSEA